MEKLETIYKKFIDEEGNLISLLQDIQEEFSYIPENILYWFSEKLDISPALLYGIATFYSQFYLKPRGKNIITVCAGTACHIKGSERLINAVRKELGLSDEDTTEDCLFTVERVFCLGACGIAPVVVINKKIHGHMTSERLIREVKGLESK